MQSFQEQVVALLENIRKVQEAYAVPAFAGNLHDDAGPEPDLECADLNDLMGEVHTTARDKGFWDDAPVADSDEELTYVASKLALIHSEVSEALEDLREPERGIGWADYDDGKLVGFASELADIIIRVLDLAGYLDIDIANIVAQKAKYNATRPVKNGKAF